MTINENEQRNLLTIRISDNGRGMSERRSAGPRPVFHDQRKTDRPRSPASGPNRGTLRRRRGPDDGPRQGTGHGPLPLPPYRPAALDAMAATIMTLVFGHPEIDFRYRHRMNGRVFRFASRDFLGVRRGAPCLSPAIFRAAKKNLQTGLKRSAGLSERPRLAVSSALDKGKIHLL